MQLVTVSSLRLIAETDKAIGVGPKNTPLHDFSAKIKWIPSSLISHNTFNGVGSYGEIEIPKWVAEQNDLDYEED